MRKMLSGWRRDLGNWALSGGNLGLLFIGFELKSPAGWQIALGLIALTSLWAWHGNLKRYRTIADTPTSRIASASQGYIEIVGRGQPSPDETLLHPFTHLPCLWYRYRVEERRNNRWTQVDASTANTRFGIEDDSGVMLIDPDGAEIVCTQKTVTHAHNQRITCWALHAGDTIYALGEHTTLTDRRSASTPANDISAKLSEWKRDRSRLLQAFDTNADGEIDINEWESVRHAAEREVRHEVPAPQPAIALLRRPKDGRPFLIADKNVTELAQHYRRWSIGHLVALALAAYGVLHHAQTGL